MEDNFNMYVYSNRYQYYKDDYLPLFIKVPVKIKLFINVFIRISFIVGAISLIHPQA